MFIFETCATFSNYWVSRFSCAIYIFFLHDPANKGNSLHKKLLLLIFFCTNILTDIIASNLTVTISCHPPQLFVAPEILEIFLMEEIFKNS